MTMVPKGSSRCLQLEAELILNRDINGWAIGIGCAFGRELELEVEFAGETSSIDDLVAYFQRPQTYLFTSRTMTIPSLSDIAEQPRGLAITLNTTGSPTLLLLVMLYVRVVLGRFRACSVQSVTVRI